MFGKIEPALNQRHVFTVFCSCLPDGFSFLSANLSFPLSACVLVSYSSYCPCPSVRYLFLWHLLSGSEERNISLSIRKPLVSLLVLRDVPIDQMAFLSLQVPANSRVPHRCSGRTLVHQCSFPLIYHLFFFCPMSSAC